MICSNFGISQGVSIQHEVFCCIYIQKLELHYAALSNFFLFIAQILPWICVGNSFFKFLSNEIFLVRKLHWY